MTKKFNPKTETLDVDEKSPTSSMYEFDPEQSITAFELAEIFAKTFGAKVSEKGLTSLSPEAQRHFKK